MPFDPTALNAALQDIANTYQVHITGTATPVDPQSDAFDITVQAVVVAPVSTDTTSTDDVSV